MPRDMCQGMQFPSLEREARVALRDEHLRSERCWWQTTPCVKREAFAAKSAAAFLGGVGLPYPSLCDRRLVRGERAKPPLALGGCERVRRAIGTSASSL